MPIININNFRGGLADSVFEPIEGGTFQTASDLEVFNFGSLLKPTVGLIQTTYNPTATNTKFRMIVTPSNGTTYFFGTDGSSQLIVYSGTITTTGALNLIGTSASPNTSHINRLWAAELNGYLLFWSNSSQIGTIKLSDNTYTENPYTFAPAAGAGPILTHEGLGKIFICGTNTIYWHDATTVTSAGTDPTLGLTIDPKYVIRSLTPYGRFLLIGCSAGGSASATIETAPSRIFVWDGASTTVDDMVNVGDVGLRAIRNINDIVHILTISNPNGEYGKNSVKIYTWSGGQVTLREELPLNNTNTYSNTPTGLVIYDTGVDVSVGKLFFVISAYTDGNTTGGVGITQGVYAFGNSANSDPFLTLYKTIPSIAADEVMPFLKFNKNNMVIAHQIFAQTTFHVHHDLTTTLASTGKYQSNAFFLNNGKKGKVKRIKIIHPPLVASVGFSVKIKHYGNYPLSGSVGSVDTFVSVPGTQGNATVPGISQSTTNATYTILEDLDIFKTADMAQIEIDLDETSTTTSAQIYFNIIIETVPAEDNI